MSKRARDVNLALAARESTSFANVVARAGDDGVSAASSVQSRSTSNFADAAKRAALHPSDVDRLDRFAKAAKRGDYFDNAAERSDNFDNAAKRDDDFIDIARRIIAAERDDVDSFHRAWDACAAERAAKRADDVPNAAERVDNVDNAAKRSASKKKKTTTKTTTATTTTVEVIKDDVNVVAAETQIEDSGKDDSDDEDKGDEDKDIEDDDDYDDDDDDDDDDDGFHRADETANLDPGECLQGARDFLREAWGIERRRQCRHGGGMSLNAALISIADQELIAVQRITFGVVAPQPKLTGIRLNAGDAGDAY